MKLLPVLCVLLCCFSALAASNQEIDYATPIVEKAIKAVGDEKKQRQMQGFTVDDRTKFEVNDQKIEITGTWSFLGVDKARGDLSANVNGNIVNVVLLVHEKQAWLQNTADGKNNPLPEDVVKFIAPNFSALRLVQRPALLLNPAFKLEPLGELKIDDRTTVGVKASRKGHPDVEIYYDKMTFLPAGMTLRVREPMEENEAEYCYRFSNYREAQGLQQFTKMIFLRNGEQRYEKSLENPRFAADLNKNLFAKPE